MKHLYIIFLLALPITLIHAQDEFIINQDFESGVTPWTIHNADASTSGFDNTINHSTNTPSGSYKLSETTGGDAHIKHSQFAGSAIKGAGGAGEYVISFWVYGAQGNRIKVTVVNGSNINVAGTFTENLAKDGSGNDVQDVTAIQTANTWQFVTTTVTLSATWATLKIFNVKDNTTTYFDDISFKRSVSEMPASGDLSTGWYPNNATSTVDSGTGIHTLIMDNANPQLKNWDNTVNADVSKYLTIELKNNSVNNTLTIIHPKSDGSGLRYVNTAITTSDATVQSYTINMTNNLWSGTMYPLTIYVRKTKSGGGYEGVAVDATQTVDFHSITVSATASLKENYTPTIVLYPNPVDTYFIAENASVNDKMEIYNVSGKRVKSLVIKSNNEKINIENLTSGVYFAKINDSKALRLIKK